MQFKTLMREKMYKNSVLFLALMIISCFGGNVFHKANEYINLNDTLLIRSIIEIDSLSNKSSFLIIEVVNNKNDSLIFLPDPFLLESYFTNENHTWVLGANEFTSPNILYLEKKDSKMIFDSDGEYKYYFAVFPKLVLVAPKDTFRIRVKFPIDVSQKLDVCNCRLFGALIYALKKQADFLISNSTEEIKFRYVNNLIREKEISVAPIPYNKFHKDLYLQNDIRKDTDISEFIWNIFRNKIAF